MLERPLSSVTNQSLCHHTVRSWLLDQRVSSKESPKSWLDLNTTGKLKLKISRNWSRQFSQDTGSGLYILSFLLFLTLFSPSLSWRDNALACTSQSIAKGRSLSDCWTCHWKPWSSCDRCDPLAFPIANFPFISNVTPNYICSPPNISHRVKPQQPGFPVPSFDFSLS